MSEWNKRLYGRWKHIMERCYCPWRKDYKYYGAKGVGVDAEWHCYRSFREWFLTELDRMRTFGYMENELVVDRIDSSGNYCKDNCRLITVADNALRSIKARDARGRFTKETK